MLKLSRKKSSFGGQSRIMENFSQQQEMFQNLLNMKITLIKVSYNFTYNGLHKEPSYNTLFFICLFVLPEESKTIPYKKPNQNKKTAAETHNQIVLEE